MNKLTAVLAIFFIIVFMTANTEVAAQKVMQVGNPAPAFTLPGSDGKEYSLSQYKGKIVVLEWFNHECPFVRKQYDSGNMQRLQEVYTGQGVIWLSVVSSAPGKQGHYDAEGTLKNTQGDKAGPTAVLLDPSGDVGRMYGAKTTPHMFIVDKEGQLAYQGAIDSIKSANLSDIPLAKNYVSAALEELLAGKPVSTGATLPYGCTVKY